MLKNLIPSSAKTFYHFSWALLSIARYGRPSKELKVIGVTGTDGKTTTTAMIYDILKDAGYKVGMINGLKFALPSKEWKNRSDNSTPGRLVIRKFLRQAVQEECDVVVLEVTSWGIQMFRVFAIAFDIAVITNFSYEHLDLHGSMDKYRKMKGKLFEMLQSPRKPSQDKIAIVNQDDDNQAFFKRFKADSTIMYSVERDDVLVKAKDIKVASDGSDFVLHLDDDHRPVHLNLAGKFNISNALAAASACRGVGASIDQIVSGLESVGAVPGRMEFVNEGQDFVVIVDFAHTPNGFKKLFETTRQMIEGHNRIIAVYGATGGRDKGRRPMVGEIAGELVDYSILTSEDPRTEDPENIASEIEIGLKAKSRHKDKDYHFVKNRAEAIDQAIQMAKPGDAVLLCSMGDYDVMYVGTGKVKWSDREAAKASLQKKLKEI